MTLVRESNLSEIDMTIAAVLAVTVLLSQCDDPQTPVERAEREPLGAEEAAAIAKEARGAVDAFLAAWNTGSSAALAKEVRFPFVTLRGNGRVRIDETPETFQPRYFEKLREDENWDHSTFDAIEPVWVAESKVHFKVQWSRHNVDAVRYMTGEILYVVTRVDEEWRIQVRSSLSSTRLE